FIITKPTARGRRRSAPWLRECGRHSCCLPDPAVIHSPDPEGAMTRILFWAGCLLILSHSTARAQRTSVSRDFPIYSNGGLPDLTPDPHRFESQMGIVDRLFNSDGCTGF